MNNLLVVHTYGRNIVDTYTCFDKEQQESAFTTVCEKFGYEVNDKDFENRHVEFENGDTIWMVDIPIEIFKIMFHARESHQLLTMKNKEESSMEEILDKWMNQNEIRHMEGVSGVRSLEKLCEEIGYKDGAFLGANPILNFLADNSGAIEALVEFIQDAGVEEWKEELESYLEVEENEEEED